MGATETGRFSERDDAWVALWPLIGGLIIIIATIAAYWPAISDAQFIWDDDQYVTNNPLLRDWEGLKQIWLTPRASPQYYPAVFTTFWIEYRMWGLNPQVYHLVNVLLHAVNALLVWRLATVLKIPGAWLIAAVFALHPVHVESVAWITERKNVLSGLFYLAAAMAYLRFDARRENPPAKPEAKGFDVWGWYGLAFMLFVLALLSKSVTCSLPAALILMMLWQRKRITVSRIVPLIPMFLVGAALGLHTAHVEREHVGAQGADFAFSIADRALIASKALLFYSTKLVWPSPLIFVYPRWTIDAANAANWWPVAIVAIVATALIIMYVRGVRGPGLALAFFAGTVFPALGFFNIYPMIFSFVADHFQYLASLGVIALIVGTAARYLHGDPQRLTALAIIVLPSLAWLTFQQSTTYQNPQTLWTRTLALNDKAWLAHANIAPILLQQASTAAQLGLTDQSTELIAKAYAHARRAVDLKSDHPPALASLSEALRMQGRSEEATAPLRRAIELDPGPAIYHFQMGRLNELSGALYEAAEEYSEAVKRESNSILYRALLAKVFARRNEIGAAVGQVDEIGRVANDPLRTPQSVDPLALQWLAEELARAGRTDEAIRTAEIALHLAQQLGMTEQIQKLQRLISDLRSPAGAGR